MAVDDHNSPVDLTEAIGRIVARIAHDRPAAVAGPPPFWAKLAALDLAVTTAALEQLADQGVVRRQPLGRETFYIADPPHAARPPQR